MSHLALSIISLYLFLSSLPSHAVYDIDSSGVCELLLSQGAVVSIIQNPIEEGWEEAS